MNVCNKFFFFNLNSQDDIGHAYSRGFSVLSVPKFTANLYCICLSIQQIYTSADAVQICGKFWVTQYLSASSIFRPFVRSRRERRYLESERASSFQLPASCLQAKKFMATQTFPRESRAADPGLLIESGFVLIQRVWIRIRQDLGVFVGSGSDKIWVFWSDQDPYFEKCRIRPNPSVLIESGSRSFGRIRIRIFNKFGF